MIETCENDFLRPKNEALCCRIDSTRSQRTLSWERGEATAIAGAVYIPIYIYIFTRTVPFWVYTDDVTLSRSVV